LPPAPIRPRKSARLAARSGDANALRAYLTAGGDANGPGTDGCFLADAAKDENFACFRLLLNRGADPHFDGELPLRRAAENGALRCLKMLLNAGADPNVTTGGWKMALTEAAYHGRLDCLDALIDAGADLNADSRAALYMATASGHLDCVQRLLAAGADPGENERGHPLHAASKFNHRNIAAVLREAIARKATS
jgi:ankyrin repeat protein